MKKIGILGVVILMAFFSACHSKSAGGLNVPAISVTSVSVNRDGKLMTAAAADRTPNSPLGGNRSPQLSWEAVDGASCYAVCMFDTDANWLHWFVTDVRKTSLGEGEYTAKEQYVGPYPPRTAGRHHYKMEVFALKKAPDKPSAKMDAVNTYSEIVDSLNVENNTPDNILARGSLVGTYANGDDTEG